MKIRSGFVSNSSSSSFIIAQKKYSLETIKNYISKLLEAENFIEKTNLSLDDICKVYEEDSVNQLNSMIDKYWKEDHIYFEGKIIVVDSTGDNSIPWSIQEALENIAIQRQHWG